MYRISIPLKPQIRHELQILVALLGERSLASLVQKILELSLSEERLKQKLAEFNIQRMISR